MWYDSFSCPPNMLRPDQIERPSRADAEKIFSIAREYIKLSVLSDEQTIEQSPYDKHELLDYLVLSCNYFTKEECDEVAYAVLKQLRQETEFRNIWDLSRRIFGLFNAAADQAHPDFEFEQPDNELQITAKEINLN